MLFKLGVIREMLKDVHQIPVDSGFDRLKGCHFLSVNHPAREKKPKKPPHKRDVCYKNKVRKESHCDCKNCHNINKDDYIVNNRF